MNLSEIEINHHFGGGVYAKETIIPAGVAMTQHVHPCHDHLSILASGRACLSVDGVESVMDAPACILIKAGSAHIVTGVTEVRWYCIHATEETDTSKIDAVIIHG